MEFAAEPLDLPLPGSPYRAAVSWAFTRQTSTQTHTFQVNEVNRNAHILVHKELSNRSAFPAGDVVEILAAVEAEGVGAGRLPCGRPSAAFRKRPIARFRGCCSRRDAKWFRSAV